MNFLVFPVYKGLVGGIHLSESLYNVIIKYVHALIVFL